jgi:hypothetical protein
MKRILPVSAFLLLIAGLLLSFRKDDPSRVTPTDNDSTVIRKIYNEALTNGQAYENLRGLCEKAPKRLSGSAGAQKGVDYMKSVMDKCGFDKVWLQPCMVPHWERGAPEKGSIVSKGTEIPVNVCALGGSQPTPSDGMSAQMVEIGSFDDLDRLGKKGIEGKIVFYNHKFDDTKINTFEAYGKAVQYRWAGPHEAERYGAVAVLVRSVTSSIDTFPHTGVMRVDSLMAKIPSAAIATKDAELLSALLKENPALTFKLSMSCAWYADVKSYNVIGEIRGSEHPEEVIVVGGHLDAWDLGNGAHDDGAGVVQSVEAIRLFRALGIRPKHTIRCVAFMNEENGGRGGEAYADSAAAKKEKHIAGLESDAGGFSPRGFGLEMKPEQKAKVRGWAPLFLPYGVYDFTHEGGGADIGPLAKSGTPLLGLEPDGSRYFDYHHTEDDLFKNVNKRELHMGAASMSAMIYLIDKYGL